MVTEHVTCSLCSSLGEGRDLRHLPWAKLPPYQQHLRRVSSPSVPQLLFSLVRYVLQVKGSPNGPSPPLTEWRLGVPVL